MDGTPPSDPGTPRRPRGRRWLIGAAIAAVVLLSPPYLLTANPKACAVCHKMRPYVKSWETSTHARAARNCLTCHAPAGLVGGFVFRARFYRKAFATITGAHLEADPVIVPGVESCQKTGCHSLNRVVSTQGDLKVDHRAHIEKADLECIRCHPGAAHEGVRGRRLIPPMRMCKDCHKDVMDDCAYCHVDTRALSEETSGGAH